MTLEENIKEWAKITESQIQDNDSEIDDEAEKDLLDAADKYNALDSESLGYLVALLEKCVDMDKLQEWIDYWKTHEPIDPKATEYIISRLKSQNSLDRAWKRRMENIRKEIG